MLALQDRNGGIRLWFDGRHSCLVDRWSNVLALIKGDLIYNLRSEPVAFWQHGNVVDLDGKVLLRRCFTQDGFQPRAAPGTVPRIELDRTIQRPSGKPWATQMAFIETLRLVSRDYQLNGASEFGPKVYRQS
jgi:hypothetical protein